MVRSTQFIMHVYINKPLHNTMRDKTEMVCSFLFCYRAGLMYVCNFVFLIVQIPQCVTEVVLLRYSCVIICFLLQCSSRT